MRPEGSGPDHYHPRPGCRRTRLHPVPPGPRRTHPDHGHPAPGGDPGGVRRGGSPVLSPRTQPLGPVRLLGRVRACTATGGPGTGRQATTGYAPVGPIGSPVGILGPVRPIGSPVGLLGRVGPTGRVRPIGSPVGTTSRTTTGCLQPLGCLAPVRPRNDVGARRRPQSQQRPCAPQRPQTQGRPRARPRPPPGARDQPDPPGQARPRTAQAPGHPGASDLTPAHRGTSGASGLTPAHAADPGVGGEACHAPLSPDSRSGPQARTQA